MLKEIHIKNFKSIRDKKLSFGSVNIFIGSNGSGKSNFLEAIGLASACFSKGISESELARKGIRQSPPNLMISAFKDFNNVKEIEISQNLSGNIKYETKISIDDSNENLQFLSEKCMHGDKKIFERSHDSDRVENKSLPRKVEKLRGMWDQIKATSSFEDKIIKNIDEFSAYRIYAPQSDYLRGTKVGEYYDGPIGVRGEGLTNAVSGLINNFNSLVQERKINDKYSILLKKALDLAFMPEWAAGVKVGNVDPKLISKAISKTSNEILYFIDKYMDIKSNTLSAYDSSEGTLFLLFMSSILCLESLPKIFAIDNIDNGLNPLMTKNLIKEIIEITKNTKEIDSNFGARQVFMTSHNPTSIDAFDLFDDNVRVFVVYRNANGLSVCDRLAPAKNSTKEEWAIIKGGKTLSQMWIEGLIPNINGLDI